MNNDVEPTPFVGREHELQQFHALLDAADGPWLMWIVGPAGQGKSRLLEAIQLACQQQGIPHSGILDFFDDTLRTKAGLLAKLAQELTTESVSVTADYQAYLDQSPSPDPFILNRLLDQMEKKLVHELQGQSQGRLTVFLVDTIELVANLGIGEWFFCRFLPRLQPNIRVVASGRILPINCLPPPDTTRIDLGTIPLAAIEHIFHLNQLTLEPDMLEKVYRVTEGQPLLVAVVVDWITNWAYPKDFALLSTDNLESVIGELLNPLLSHFTLESQVILYLAHAYHGLDAEQLSAVYPAQDLGIVDYDNLLHRLSRLPYVKRAGEAGALRLHDFYREQIDEHIWPMMDLDYSWRQRISQLLIPLYEAELEALETKKSAPLSLAQLDALHVVHLYHLLFANRERAYGQLWELLNRSWHAYRFDYMDVLLVMARQVNRILSIVGQFDQMLDQIEKTARAKMYLEIWKTEEALQLAESVEKDPAGIQGLLLTCLVTKGIALGRLGKINEAIRALVMAFEGYETLLNLAEAARSGEQRALARITTERGITTLEKIQPERYLILNTIGYLERQRGYFYEAEAAFRKSFELSTAEGDQVWRASAATQLGTIARYKGEFALAYDFMEIGLGIRRRMGQPGRIAFSLHALGLLQMDDGRLREARESFSEALTIWRELEAVRDLASCLVNIGWVDYLDSQYDQAEHNFEEAHDIYQALSLRRELPDLHYKQGMLKVAQAKEVGDLPERTDYLLQAEGYFQAGIEIGRTHQEMLPITLCLIGLCRIAEMRGEYDRISVWAEEIKQFKEQGYRFDPVYAELEQVLGDVAFQQAPQQAEQWDIQLFDQATDHYCQMFLYLVRHSPHLYRRQREFLRRWLLQLPQIWLQRAAERLIDCWEQQPDNLAINHPGFIRTIKLISGL